MVNLFFEIKRNLPLHLRDPLKISDPNLSDKLVSLYKEYDDSSIQRLIEVFFERADEEWSKKLNPSKKSRMLELIKPQLQPLSASNSSDTDSSTKPRYYRGVLVET